MSQLTHVQRSPRWPWLAACVLLSVLAVVALVWIQGASARKTGSPKPMAAAADLVFSNIPIGKADAVYSSALSVCSCQPTYYPMPGMTKTFKLGGTTARPVIVLFDAVFHSFPPGVTVFIKLAIDGAVVEDPGDTIQPHANPVGEPDARGTHGFNFVTPPLSPGSHTATILWRDNGAGPGYVNHPTMLILHK